MPIFEGTNASETLSGEAGDDTVRGLGGDDTLDGGAGGSDLLEGGAGVDRLTGGEGDTLSGGDGVDLGTLQLLDAAVDLDLTGLTAGGSLTTDYGIGLIGLEGIQVLTGDEADRIKLGDLSGFVNAGAGADTIIGGAGGDYLRGGAGDDRLSGGEGFDRVGFYTEAPNGARADLRIRTAQDTGAGMDILRDIEALSGTVQADRLIGDGDTNWLWGAGPSGAGVNGADTLIGNGGDDLLSASQGDHSLLGGKGVDTLEVSGNSVDFSGGLTLDLALQGARQDTGQGSMFLKDIENLSGSRFADVFRGNGGANALTGKGGADLLEGRGGDDFLFGDGMIEMVPGPFGFGGQILFVPRVGLGGDDTLIGGAGADGLGGGFGADLLTGGADADTFFYGDAATSTAAAADRITDFHTEEDVLDLSDMDADVGTGGDQAFVLVRNFSGAAGEARLSFDRATRTTTLELNTDADAEAESVILFSGRITRDVLNDDSFVG